MSKHSERSSYREKMLEYHLLTGLMAHFWNSDLPDLEILHAAIDDQGYDLMLSHDNVVWLLQLKSIVSTGNNPLKIHKKLFSRSNGFYKVGVLLQTLDEGDGASLKVKYSLFDLTGKSYKDCNLADAPSKSEKENDREAKRVSLPQSKFEKTMKGFSLEQLSAVLFPTTTQ